MTDVEITSFGYLHGEPPAEQDITLDLRRHFRDPHVSPELKYLTAHDDAVVSAVLKTPGICELLTATALTVKAYLRGPSSTTVRVSAGCAGGRHRAAVVASTLADVLRIEGIEAEVSHRDLHLPVVERTEAGERS